MSIAAMVETMMERGVDRDIILLAIQTAEAHSTGIPPDSVAEKRRAYDRERKRAKAHSTGIPPDSTGIPETVLTTKNNNKEDKKVRTAKHGIPHDWQPNEKHFEAAEKLSIPRESVLSKAEDMRIWAQSKDEKRSAAGWDATFHGFLRRDAPKLAIRGSPTTSTITPQSQSWNAWKAHFRDTGQNVRASLMDKSASDGKPFTVPTEYPPGWKP